MPYIQLDLPQAVDADATTALARRLVAIYADVMETQSRIVNVSYRVLDAGPMRLEGGELVSVIVVMCDIRRGRTPEHRLKLAESFVEAVADALNFPALRIVVEFTQHSGDEMYRYGAMADDWDPREAVAVDAAAG